MSLDYMTFGGDSSMVETIASEAILTHAKPNQPQCQASNKSLGTQLQTIVYSDINAHPISHQILASLEDRGDGSDEVVYAAAKVVLVGPEALDYSLLIGGRKRVELIPIYEKVLGIHLPTIEYVGDRYSMLENLKMIEGLSSIYDIPSFPDEDKNPVTKIPPLPPDIQWSEMTPTNPQFFDGNRLSSKFELNTEDIMSISLDDISKWLISFLMAGSIPLLSHRIKSPSKTDVEKLSDEKFKVCISLEPALAQLIVEMEKTKFEIPKHAQEFLAKVKEISEGSELHYLKFDMQKEGYYDRRTKHDQA
ncbi:hypothetical protein LIER_19690 [Lithospermum erythrorhizon]|uniref:Uncharacterized protein n=1 Tax=Lithospermum erythrorhizon TaxID=34254 RepID=A0AAV3QLN6_LITER